MTPPRILTATGLPLLLGACSTLYPTPTEFPKHPRTPINPLPTFGLPPTATARPHSLPISPTDMAAARAFFLTTKTAIAAGDDTLIAERVKYPITVRISGREVRIDSPGGFSKNYQDLFDEKAREAVWQASEDDLVVLPEGVRAAGGLLWFGRFCKGSSCSESEFLITQIDH